MRRLVRPAPFARGRLELRLRDLPKLQIEEWPSHLKMARGILIEELNLQKKTAADVLQHSLVAAHACAWRMEQSALDVFQMRNRKTLRKIFARMARCLKRLPASQRRAIDGRVRIYLRQMPMDSERVETLIETLVVGFGKRPKGQPSLTALRAVTPGAPSAKILTETSDARLRHRFAKAAALLQQDYAALPATDQRDVEVALTALVQERRDTFNTVDVCRTLARVLDSNTRVKPSSTAAGLTTDYVTNVARIWRQHGLRPSRATHPSNATYRSKFHRFVDLVLTFVVDPWSKRHDGNQGETLTKLRKVHAELSEDIRRLARPALPRSDVEWLVSEDHVKKALALKTTLQAP